MELLLEKLIGAIVTWVSDKQSYITKTKLLKLLYLFDVEYYRMHRELFTGFKWKFFHLGPWAPEYEKALNNAIIKGFILSKNSEFNNDCEFLLPVEKIGTEAIFSNSSDESVLRNMLNLWAESSTGEILDYVYFQSPPMETAIRNHTLDFSVIPEEKPATYVKASSGKTKDQIKKLRESFEKRQRASKAKQTCVFKFTPPNYDDEYFEAMNKIEAS